MEDISETQTNYFNKEGGLEKTISLSVDLSNELSGQKNETPSQANRPIVIDRSHLQGTQLRVFLRNVQHGHLDKKSAVFVTLEFHFIFDEHRFRFTSADIIAKWHERRQPTGSKSKPQSLEVAGLAPGRVYGNPTKEERKWTYGIALPISAGVGIANIGVNPSVNLESAFPRDHRLTISGFQIRGGAKWSIHENARQASGIPNKFTCAMLVPYGKEEGIDDIEGCQASISVTMRTNWPGVSLKGMPWNADDPVLFIPGQDFGVELSTREFEKLTEEDWKKVVDYPTEFKNEFISSRSVP